jgi:hypothetical protein
MNFTCSLPSQFVGLIRTVLKAYSFDLNRDYLWLRLDKDDSGEVLVVEKLDKYRAVVSSYRVEAEIEIPLISLEFLIESCCSDGDGNGNGKGYSEIWCPLSLKIEAGEERAIASASSHGKLIAYCDEGMKEAVDLCFDWLRALEAQMWHDDGLPCPNVTVTARYARHEAITVKPTDAPVLEFEKDYLIRANRLGLYTLASSITGVLSGVNGGGKGDSVTVFDLGAISHALRVELVEGRDL